MWPYETLFLIACITTDTIAMRYSLALTAAATNPTMILKTRKAANKANFKAANRGAKFIMYIPNPPQKLSRSSLSPFLRGACPSLRSTKSRTCNCFFFCVFYLTSVRIYNYYYHVLDWVLLIRESQHCKLFVYWIIIQSTYYYMFHAICITFLFNRYPLNYC